MRKLPLVHETVVRETRTAIKIGEVTHILLHARLCSSSRVIISCIIATLFPYYC